MRIIRWCGGREKIVFYHNRNALGNQIPNLVKILTEDELIERVSGPNPSFKFEAIYKENDDFEIANGGILKCK